MSNTEFPEGRQPATGLRDRDGDDEAASGRDDADARALTDDPSEHLRADRRPGGTDRPTQVTEPQAGNAPVAAGTDTDDNSLDAALVSDPESLRRRWESVQVGFVDDPRQAVDDADDLVSSVIEDLADGFRQRRQRLESRWSTGGDASTDDLRDSFQRYRDFFDRLLKV
jgi:hypothetical protein